MALKLNFFVTWSLVWYLLTIIESESKEINQVGKLNENIEQASIMITEYPLGISEVIDDASGVFGKILRNMFSNKKILGLESFYLK